MTESKHVQADETIEVEAIRAITIYKTLVLGLLWFLVPIGIAAGVAALFGGLFIGSMTFVGLWFQFRFTTMTVRVAPKGGATARHRHDPLSAPLTMHDRDPDPAG